MHIYITVCRKGCLNICTKLNLTAWIGRKYSPSWEYKSTYNKKNKVRNFVTRFVCFIPSVSFTLLITNQLQNSITIKRLVLGNFLWGKPGSSVCRTFITSTPAVYWIKHTKELLYNSQKFIANKNEYITEYGFSIG